MKYFIIVFLLAANSVIAQQSNIAQFAVWRPKPGMQKDFENGYKKHLEWHKSNGDTWNWYGWFITSGPRFGLFVDATTNHSWKELDNAVKPAVDRADNEIHVYPFADFQELFRLSYLPLLSITDSNSLKQQFLRMVTLHASNIIDAQRVLEKLKVKYHLAGIKNLTVYKMIDGGDLNKVLLFIGAKSREEYGKSENIANELAVIEISLKIKVITSVTSEMLTYRPELSLFPIRK